MRKSATPKPVPIPRDLMSHVEITPDIARQIVAMVIPGIATNGDMANILERVIAAETRLDVLHRSTDGMIVDMGKRIAALEDDKRLLDWADAEGHHDAGYPSLRAELRDQGTRMPMATPPAAPSGELLMPPPVEVPSGQRSRNPILDNYTQPAAPTGPMPSDSRLVITNPDARSLKLTQPAAPDADEAAVESIYYTMRDNGTGGEYVENKYMWEFARAILAAIRSGAIRLPEDAPQIAEMRAKLAAYESDAAAAAGELRVSVKDCGPGTLAGKLLSANVLLRHGNGDLLSRAVDAEADRDRLAAQVEELKRDLGTMRKAYTLTMAEAERLKADLAAMKERAEKAEEKLAGTPEERLAATAFEDWQVALRERDAARAEADALRAEVAALKARKVKLPQRFAIDAVEGNDRSGYPEAQLEIEASALGRWIHYSETADAICAAGVEVMP